jgi:hypothetical protein
MVVKDCWCSATAERIINDGCQSKSDSNEYQLSNVSDQKKNLKTEGFQALSLSIVLIAGDQILCSALMRDCGLCKSDDPYSAQR